MTVLLCGRLQTEVHEIYEAVCQLKEKLRQLDNSRYCLIYY